MNNTQLKKIKDSIKLNPGFAPGTWIDTLVFMLLWAKFLPQTENEAIGFFDVLNTVDTTEKIEKVLFKLRKDGPGMLPEFIEFMEDNTNRVGYRKQIENFENLRSQLLSVAKIVATGSNKEIETIIDLILEIDIGNGGPESHCLNKGILDFSKKVFDNVSINSELNCLGPVGALAAYKFSENRDTFHYVPYDSIERFASSLTNLYGKVSPSLSRWDKREISFVGFEWGSRGDWELVPYFHEFLNNDFGEWQNINDFQCKSIYLAHENTKDTTIAITNMGTLFSNNNGISYFRKKLIDNNWLETVIELPSHIFNSSGVPGALLILKKNRKSDDKIQFIDFTNCQNHSEAKRGTLLIPEREIENLFKLYKNKKIDKNSILVSADDIKSQEYNLSVRRYLLTDEDKEIKNILNKRETVTLNSLVDFVRPLNSSPKNIKNGTEISEILISDINSIGEINEGSKKVNVGEEFFSRSNLPFVKRNDLIISIKGTIGKIGFISTDLENTIPGTSLCILRVHDSSSINPEYLLQYLRSEICQRLISSSSQGSTIPFLSIKELKNLSIPIPSIAEQNSAKKISKRTKELFISLDEMQNELNQLTANGWLQLNNDSLSENSYRKKSVEQKDELSNWSVSKSQLENYLRTESKRISDTDLKEAIFEILKSRLEETDNSEESKDDSS